MFDAENNIGESHESQNNYAGCNQKKMHTILFHI